ncbi:lipopolysaccharide biosynthesis protein [Bradyrhizobium guangzhouense]|uniref:lipopolysaccharide biosynthesis protein n=1 Tax=Bradyrhizobium guangzhouense TaxID=1325095 RepID=UPI001009B780|nr:polysaccharide transporter [Bradyrhizobium guangzhouense]RXH16944.1 polysaccharide transporter [Bradyrhizobium guangzhouense]
MGRLFALILRNRDFALGVIDQAILSGSSFLLTLVLAASLEAKSFGLFSIAAAFSPLLDVFFRGLFEDGLPAAANRIPRARWPQLRSTVYLVSLAASGAIGLVVVIAGALTAGHERASGLLLCALGLAIPASRIQSVFRKFCFLDAALVRLVSSSVLYLLVLSGMIGLLMLLGDLEAASAMLAIAVAAASAASVLLLFPKDLGRPSRRAVRWSLKRLSRSGWWFVGTSLIYWIGSIGLIPACGLFSGLEAGGAVRILIVIFAPLSQISTAIVAVKVPRIARVLRTGSRQDALDVGRQNALLFGSIAAAYGIAIVLIAAPLLLPLLQHRGYDVTVLSVSMMGLALTLDAIWYALALPLIALGQPRMYLVSRLGGLFALGLILPAAVYAFGVLGAVASMCASSAVSLVVLALRDGLSLPERRATA